MQHLHAELNAQRKWGRFRPALVASVQEVNAIAMLRDNTTVPPISSRKESKFALRLRHQRPDDAVEERYDGLGVEANSNAWVRRANC
jgi:hypothetical protein